MLTRVQVLTKIHMVAVIPMVAQLKVVAAMARTLVHVFVASGRLAGVQRLTMAHVGVWADVGGAEGRERGVWIHPSGGGVPAGGRGYSGYLHHRPGQDIPRDAGHTQHATIVNVGDVLGDAAHTTPRAVGVGVVDGWKVVLLLSPLRHVVWGPWHALVDGLVAV